ncbi:MAG: DUF4838 domain-containing protein [Candidatus Hydrogenedentales bacterium]|jgi:hypothetical protein
MRFPRIDIVVVALCACFASLAQAQEQLVLAENGASAFRIVVGASASPSEHYAANELQRFLKEITGVELPIATDADPIQPHEILVGKSKHLDSLNLNIDWAALGTEGIVMRTHEGHLVLAGGTKRGAMYAVYNFLDEVLGCRWFTQEVSRIPKMKRIAVAPLNITRVPVFEYRAETWSSAANADWAARNYINTCAALDEEHGGCYAAIGGGHSFHAILPPGEFFATHPEYYPLIGGIRTAQKSQLCFTNPDVVKAATEWVLKQLREKPKTDFVWVAQMDCRGWCECPSCDAIFKREGSESGPLLEFVNQIADAIKPEFPDAKIATYAYGDTRKPPKTVKPRANVTVMVCPIELCYSHPVATCELNRTFVDDLAGWAKLTDKYYLFDYTANFDHYVMPQPNLRVLRPNYQLYAKNNVRGIFALGNPGKGTELAELRAYLLARLMWNPDCDVKRDIDEYMEAMYGKAAEPIKQYFALMHDKVEKDNIHCGISASPMLPHLSLEMIAKAKVFFDEAERLAETEEIHERVRCARLPIQHIELEWLKPHYRIVDDTYAPEVSPATLQLARQFVEVATRNDITQISEAVPPAWHVERLQLWSKAWPAVHMENDTLRIEVVPGLGGRIISLLHKPTKHEFLLQAQADGREYPKSAGYEEYSERGWRSHGWQEEFECTQEKPGKVVRMSALLPNGLTMERTLELSESEPMLTIHSRLVNNSDNPISGCLRTHPMFQMGELEKVVATYTDIAGEKHTMPLVLPVGKLRGQFYTRGDKRPNGVWSCANEELGLAVEQTFDTATAEECLLDWLPAKQRFNLELASTEKVLARGESLSLKHAYRFISLKESPVSTQK